MKTDLTISGAVNAGLRDAMEQDDTVLLMGEDIGALGGVFRVTDGLQKQFGEDRVVDTPLAESGIVGTATGLAMSGFRPVVEIQFEGFVFPAFNQIVSQLSRYRYRSEGHVHLPVVIRMPYGGGIGAVEHHGESPEALFTHIPGLRVLTPATAEDAYWQIQQAISENDPVIFFEPKRRYWQKGSIDPSTNPLGPYQARIEKPGDAATIVSYGPTVATALEAATAAEAQGFSVEVVNLRSLSPIDFDTIAASVEKTGRLIVVHEAPVFGGLGGEITARLTSECFDFLEAPPQRVGGYHMPYPVARLEFDYLPSVDRVMLALDEVLNY
jgi:pyruvate dehydrogenase E1 component beta subunit